MGDSDSDSDDDGLLNFQAFGPTKRKRTEEKKIAKGFSILEEALQHANQMRETDARIAMIKQENDEYLLQHHQKHHHHQKQQPQQQTQNSHASGNNASDKNAPSSLSTPSMTQKNHEEEFLAKVQQSIAEAKAAPKTNKNYSSCRREAGSLVEDLENVLGKDRRRALGKARDTDLSSTLGVRHTIHFDPHRMARYGAQYFDAQPTTTKAYIQQLRNDVLRKLVSPDQKILQKAWIQPLRKCTQNINDLNYFLNQQVLARAQVEHQLETVPPAILLWLLRVACSADEDYPATTDANTNTNTATDQQKPLHTVPLRDGALTSLLGLFRVNKCQWKVHSVDNRGDNDDNNNNNEATKPCSKPEFLSLSELAVQLHCWVPLTTDAAIHEDDYATKTTNAAVTATRTSSRVATRKTAPSTHEDNANANDKNNKPSPNNNNNNNNNNNHMDRTNPCGLQRLLTLWNSAFDLDLVSATSASAYSNNTCNDDDTESVGAKHATRCLVLLAKMGLDRSVQSTERTFQLLSRLRSTIERVLKLVSRDVFPNDESKLLAWMKGTINVIIQEFVQSNLGTGDEAVEDCRDEKAWLCFSLLCRLLPFTSPKSQLRNKGQDSSSQRVAVATQFKALACVQVLSFLIFGKQDDVNNSKRASWEEEVCSIVASCQNDKKVNYNENLAEKAKSSLCWLVLCSSLTTIVMINTLRGDVEDDSARCLATVEVALGCCFDVGMELFQHSKDEDATETSDSGQRKNEYKTSENARDVARLLELLELQYTPLGGRMNAAMMNPNFSRVAYFIQCRKKYFQETLGKAAYLGGRRAIVQNTLDGWLKKETPTAEQQLKQHSNEDDDSDDDSDDDDDDNDEVVESPSKKQRRGIVAAAASSVAVTS